MTLPDTIFYMVAVRKRGREFEAIRYYVVPEGYKESEDKQAGKLKEVRQWVKATFPNLLQFPKDEHDEPDVYESWW
jgi:hypothetical protein